MECLHYIAYLPTVYILFIIRQIGAAKTKQLLSLSLSGMFTEPKLWWTFNITRDWPGIKYHVILSHRSTYRVGKHPTPLTLYKPCPNSVNNALFWSHSKTYIITDRFFRPDNTIAIITNIVMVTVVPAAICGIQSIHAKSLSGKLSMGSNNKVITY